MQVLIRNFIQDNLTSANYEGEGLNNRGYVQVYFRVGNQIMVICPSNELYPPISEFGDSRPVRTITTIYFVNLTRLARIRIQQVWP